MIRTQISLDGAEYQRVKEQAKQLGIPVAEWVRRIIRDALPNQDEGPWMAYAGLVESGDSNSSQSIDDIRT